MSEIEQLPEPWQRLFRNAQVKSQNDLAERANVSTGTVNRIIRKGRTSGATVRALADVLTEGDINPIWEAIGASRRDHGEFPVGRIADDLRLLTYSQREALIALVRSMAHPDGKAGEEHDSSAPNTRAGNAGAVTGDPDAAERRWEGEGGNGLNRGQADASTDPPVSDLERRRHEKHIKPATTEVDAARGEAEDEARNRSTKPPSPLGGFDPDEES